MTAVTGPSGSIPARFNIAESELDRYLDAALSRGGDYADLYFELIESCSVSLDESMIKSAGQGVSVGCGVRVVSGERTGYAYTDDLAPERILQAANTAAHIAEGQAAQRVSGFERPDRGKRLYDVVEPAGGSDLAAKVALVRRADEAARRQDPRVFQVQASYIDSLRRILIVTSEGLIVTDAQPMARMNVTVLARDGEITQNGGDGAGGRVGLDFFETQRTPEQMAKEAARQAVVQLEASDSPAGEMTVVLGPGWPGILLHEAVGHGLEADFNRKQLSAYSGLLGESVASPLCTVVDEGVIERQRGSIEVDDEGQPAGRTVLIENGVLKGYLQDRLSSRLLKTAPTGNGRRQSYMHPPMPRMTNTYLLPGEDDPQDILRSVSQGLYCANFGGGQVDITSGKFVFTASESYLIEDGKLTRPVRNATLIGNGPEVMRQVSRVGHDLALDRGVGTCGKNGQSVPVGVGIPTIKIDRLTVGGSGRPSGSSFQ